ncbi:MAG: STAS domain-containing protein [Pseudomonadota bacterium]
MHLSSTERNGDIVVRMDEARIDAAIAVSFKDAMRAHFSGPHPRVVLDLSQVEFVDSSGLGAIVAILKEAGDDKSFALAGMTPGVEKVFRLTRMDSVFTIYPSVEDGFADEAHAS